MEVFTILRRDILRKKGIFICITLLTILIVAAFLSILGVGAEFKRGLDNLKSELKSPNILSYTYSTYYDSELKTKIENVEGVDYVIELESLTSVNNARRIKHNGNIIRGKDSNTYLIESFSDNKDNIKLYNLECNKYEDNLIELKKGEIYLPLGLKSKLGCEVGDIYIDDFGVYPTEGADGKTVYTSKEYEFVIKGFVASPMLGSNVIGWKEVFISDEDFNELKELSIEGTKVINDNHLSSQENYSLVDIVYKIYSNGTLKDYELLRKVNAETKLTNFAEGTITASESSEYTGMYITIIGGVLVGFVITLLIINLIVISSSVSGEIETDYKKLGILKALGFTNFKIGLIISLLYLFAEAIGFILGIILSIFLKRYLGNIFVPITACLPYNYISIINVLIIFGIIAATSILFITIKLLKLRKVSPIKAINGTTSDIYFPSRFNTPISKRFLSLSISIKQLLTSPIRYLSIVFVTALLSFFMLTSIRMSNFTKSENVYKVMGEPISDIAVSAYSSNQFTYEMMDEIKEVALKYSEIDFMVVRCSTYVSLNEDTILANVNMNPKDTLGIYKGRYPKYDNEFITTKNICDRYNLKIGDKVNLSSKSGSNEYILVGVYQNTSDTGKNIGLSYEGATKLDDTIKLYYMNLQLKDKSKVDNVINALKDISNDRFRVIDSRNVEIPELNEYRIISDIICIIILAFAVIFALVSVRLLTVKTFNQERLDLGIYKSQGFNVFNLRNTMSLRFMIASILGIIIGIILSLLFSNQLLGLMLSNLGMNIMNSTNSILDYILVIVLGAIVAYIGAFIASRRIKRISTRELVVE